MQNPALSFKPMKADQEALVLDWLCRPHCSEWFQGQGLANTIDGLHRFVKNDKPWFDAWIAFCDDEPFGYLMTSRVTTQELSDPNSHFSKWGRPDQKAATLDLLIGEEKFLGKGLATPMITGFIKQRLADMDLIFIDPEATNAKAIHVYEKAGFVKLEQFVASWHPVPHWLMCRKEA